MCARGGYLNDVVDVGVGLVAAVKDTRLIGVPRGSVDVDHQRTRRRQSLSAWDTPHTQRYHHAEAQEGKSVGHTSMTGSYLLEGSTT
jgi:hypothetical protein